MIDQALLARLKPVLERRRRECTIRGAAGGLALAAIAALFLLSNQSGMSFGADGTARVLLLPGGLLLGLLGGFVGRKLAPGPSRLARRLEETYPDLEGRLTTSLQQTPGEDGRFNFLQDHLFTETIRHSTQRNWQSIAPDSSLNVARALMVTAFAAFAILSLWFVLPSRQSAFLAEHPQSAGLHEDGVEVTPGDTELEKGTALILLAKFHNQMPAAAELVIGESVESERRLPLVRSLSDPVYGGSVPEVKEPFSYKVAWDGGSTRAFKVRVFEYPKLERSDVTLTYPDYTKLPVKRIEDTRHTSAVEGTRLDVELALNKPVASAVLEPRKAKDATEEVPALTLEVSPDKGSAVLRGHIPTRSARYELVLTDADGRRSKQSVPFSFDVVPNRVPEMKLASPKGDQRPSALQEISFDGTVWDDFGVVACGLEVTTPGGETVTVEFGKDVPAKEKRAFQKLLSMEDLSAVPDQLFAWHTWADDFGPDGKVRRTKGDLFFAEVRAFEEIFRQGEGMESQQQQQEQQQQQQGQQGQAEQLVKLQKQIITATWKLAQRPEPARKAEDIEVVRDSQADAQSQAEAAAGEAGGSPATAALWQGALQNMQRALEKLEKAAEAPSELASAVTPEQAAYQALLKLKEREFQGSRQNRQQQQQGQQGQSQGEQQQQQQLDQLDLAKNEDRYETQREAQAQQSAERREQMQVLNRLKELAQRQDDVNEKLKELQTALNEAKTEEEKEAARRELKRLEEEQRQMLADADELKQRMEQQQNQSETAEQREQLDQARENMQQAAEAAAQGQASQALASGTRAQEQMEQMREELRKQSAGAFEEELRQMRADAREIARKQEEIAKEMSAEQSDPSDRPDPSEKKRQAPNLGETPKEDKLAEQLQQQEQRTGDLVKRAQELSEQAEPSEPLLSRQIYETARKFAQDDANAVKETQQEFVREGRLSREGFDQLRELQEREQAGRALRLTNELQQQNLKREAQRTGERAREGLNRLRDGIEQAAESVLGDDRAALQLAEQQLQEAADALQREMEEQSGEQNQQANAGNQRQPQQGQQPRNGQRPGGEPREGDPQTAQNEPREGQQEPRQNQPREGQQETAQNQEGQQPGQRSSQPQQGQANARQPGQRQGEGRPQGEPQPGERQPGDQNLELAQNEQQQEQQPGEGQQPGEQQRQGMQPGEQQGETGGPGENREGPRTADNRRGQRQTNNANDGGRGGGPEEDFIETARGPRDRRPAARDPLTGEGFTNWSDSLREAEELVDETELRNNIAQARERARQMRLDMRKAEKKPDWAVVQLEIVKPLVEVRDRIRQELARRDSDKALVPVDRDPVPAQFTENVRRYYEQLGKE